MPRHCRISDPVGEAGASYPFGVNAKGVPIFECIRLLAGSLDIENKNTGLVTKPRSCIITQKKRRPGLGTIKQIVDVMFDGDLTVDEVEIFLVKSATDNRDFWNEVKAELCLCLVARKSGNYVEYFLYLYRIFEFISVALPLVYASSEVDYKKALVFIKSLSTAGRDADLAIFRNFASLIASKGSYRDLTIDYSFESLQENWSSGVIEQVLKYVLNDTAIKRKDDPAEGVLSIKFSSVPSFFVTCRNRLFHNASTEANFNLDAMGGASEFCRLIADPTMYWLSLVVVEILKTNARRYV